MSAIETTTARVPWTASETTPSISEDWLSVIIGLGTATIGSTVAAKGLGEVIIAGLQSNNVAFVLQGGLVVALLAVLIHDGMGMAERAVARRLGRPVDEIA